MAALENSKAFPDSTAGKDLPAHAEGAGDLCLLLAYLQKEGGLKAHI